MKITIDPKKCVRCGLCEVLTNGAIISPGNKPVYLNPKANLIDPKIQKNIKTAANSCPQKAIEITT